MHRWGDKWEGWDDLRKAEDTIYFYGKKLGQVGGQLKEKYGSIRWYASIHYPMSLHDIVKAGHVAYRWSPDDHPFLCLLDNFSKAYIPLISPLLFKYRCFMYGFAYHMACKKFPHIKEEILCDADHDELLFKKEREFLLTLRAKWKEQDE